MARYLTGITARSWTISISNTATHSGSLPRVCAMMHTNAARSRSSVMVIIVYPTSATESGSLKTTALIAHIAVVSRLVIATALCLDSGQTS